MIKQQLYTTGKRREKKEKKRKICFYRHPEISQHPNKKMLIYLKGGGLCVPGDGYSSCNNRCNVAAPHLCTAMTDPTLDLGENNLGSTIASSNSTLNPAFHDFSKSIHLIS